MRSLEITTQVGEDRRITVQLPPDIPLGEHKIILVIEEQINAVPNTAPVLSTSTNPKSTLNLQAYPWSGWPEGSTFRREELYDDE